MDRVGDLLFNVGNVQNQACGFNREMGIVGKFFYDYGRILIQMGKY